MNRVNPCPPWSLLIVLAGLSAAAAARADALSVVQMLRQGGCGGIVPIAPPLRHNPSLDRTAEQWAGGHSINANAQGLRVSGPDEALIERLRRTECRAVSSRDLREVGIYRRGADTWLVLATSFVSSWSSPAPGAAYSAPATPSRAGAPAARPPVSAPAAGSAAPASATPAMAARALQLVNEARARGAQCGKQSFGPAPPLTLSGTLAGVALGHASDMAVHDYFEHEDLSGQSPADRVRAAGYHEQLVGENIAYGPQSVEEVVKGWLASPGHCENIMDPRFAQMGIGLAPGRASRRGLFWVQLLAEPRA
ncbi:MAG TPA: CAP domain-containing protein [Steroidobacteraceae bacterium]|nr:CAP domain-containing protein [Steroidobacteraceae bacterium]